MAGLRFARYGKDNIRLCKFSSDVDAGVQKVVELTIQTMLQGDTESCYTKGDNAATVPTDTQKQTTYILAEQNPVTHIETFASILSQHLVDTYPHIHAANVRITQRRWKRMSIDGKPHPHSFYRDGDEKHIVDVLAQRDKGIIVKSGIRELLLLKTIGSAFQGYDTTDPYTILPETDDRLLSTQVKCDWTWRNFGDVTDVKQNETKFDDAFESVRKITFDMFAKDNSCSVQNTVYKMSEKVLETWSDVDEVAYTLPNKHYFDIDRSWHKGWSNTGKDAEVYIPETDPSGVIECVLKRKSCFKTMPFGFPEEYPNVVHCLLKLHISYCTKPRSNAERKCY